MGGSPAGPPAASRVLGGAGAVPLLLLVPEARERRRAWEVVAGGARGRAARRPSPHARSPAGERSDLEAHRLFSASLALGLGLSTAAWLCADSSRARCGRGGERSETFN